MLETAMHDGEDGSEVEAMVAARVRTIRAARRMTLDGLAAASGVSRAMLSRIERGESSPTAALLLKLCRGLGVAPTALLGGEAVHGPEALVRRAQQPVWREAGSGYLRRTVSPAGPTSPVEIAEVEMPAGAAVVLDALDRAGHEHHLWMLVGTVEVTRGCGAVRLGPGDRLRYLIEGPVGLRNVGSEPARYASVTASSGGGEGRS